MSEYKLELNEEQSTNPFAEKIINQVKLVSKCNGISLEEAVELMRSVLKSGNKYLGDDVNERL